jgi:hypothetical protein
MLDRGRSVGFFDYSGNEFFLPRSLRASALNLNRTSVKFSVECTCYRKCNGIAFYRAVR